MIFLKPGQLAKLLNKKSKRRLKKDLDAIFSKVIRSRDAWTCQRCGKYHKPPTNALHCSHYWGRTRDATRFCEDNCVALCYGCHRLWEGDKQGAYKDFMIKRLGKEKFDELEIKANYGYKLTAVELEILIEFFKKKGEKGVLLND